MSVVKGQVKRCCHRLIFDLHDWILRLVCWKRRIQGQVQGPLPCDGRFVPNAKAQLMPNEPWDVMKLVGQTSWCRRFNVITQLAWKPRRIVERWAQMGRDLEYKICDGLQRVSFRCVRSVDWKQYLTRQGNAGFPAAHKQRVKNLQILHIFIKVERSTLIDIVCHSMWLSCCSLFPKTSAPLGC